MNRVRTLAATIVALTVLGGACGGNDTTSESESAPADATTSTTEQDSPAADDAEREAAAESVDTDEPVDGVASATNEEPAADADAPAASQSDDPEPTEAPAIDPDTESPDDPAPAEPADTEAPEAPSGLVCLPGGGSGEVTLEWSAPADPDDVATVQIYLSEDGGSFTRIHTYTQDQLLVAEGSTWTANVYPVPYGLPLELAVTYDDAAGNESGWNPVDAFVPFGAGPCNTGEPDTPTIVSATRGAGSGEVRLTVEIDATDIIDWAVEVDQGSDWFTITSYLVDNSVSGQVGIDIWPLDWTLPATYRVVAIDHHGNGSAAGFRECATPISPGDVAC